MFRESKSVAGHMCWGCSWQCALGLITEGLEFRSRTWDTSVSRGLLLQSFEWCEYLCVWSDQTEIQG